MLFCFVFVENSILLKLIMQALFQLSNIKLDIDLFFICISVND